MKKIKQYLKRLLSIINKPEMRILPGNLAFFLVLSLIPLITLIGFGCTLFHISLDGIIYTLSETLPQAVLDIIIPAFNSPTVNAGLSMIIGFIVASNGAHSIIIASNTLYKQESTDPIKFRVKAFFMLVIMVVLFLFTLVVLAFGNLILKYVLGLEFLQNVAEQIYTVFILLKWPTAFVVIFFMVKMLYTMAPSTAIPSKFMNRGAIFTTFGLVAVTAIYSYYVSNFANYSLFYGSLSNIVILMIWIYILSYILVVGIAINSENYRMAKIDADKKE